MKTLIQILEIFVMLAQLCIAIIPFIIGFTAKIMYMGLLSGWGASNDLIEHLTK
jgi:hypothetical protein